MSGSPSPLMSFMALVPSEVVRVPLKPKLMFTFPAMGMLMPPPAPHVVEREVPILLHPLALAVEKE